VCLVLRARTGVLGAHVNRAFCQPFAGGTVFVGTQVGAHECLWARTWVFVGWQAGVCGRTGGCKDEGLQVPPTCAKAALALVLGPKNGDHRSHSVAHRWSPMGDVSMARVPPLWTSIASSTPPLALNSWGTRRTLPAPVAATHQPLMHGGGALGQSDFGGPPGCEGTHLQRHSLLAGRGVSERSTPFAKHHPSPTQPISHPPRHCRS